MGTRNHQLLLTHDVDCCLHLYWHATPLEDNSKCLVQQSEFYSDTYNNAHHIHVQLRSDYMQATRQYGRLIIHDCIS